jgi:hypothetical protein
MWGNCGGQTSRVIYSLVSSLLAKDQKSSLILIQRYRSSFFPRSDFSLSLLYKEEVGYDVDATLLRTFYTFTEKYWQKLEMLFIFS